MSVEVLELRNVIKRYKSGDRCIDVLRGVGLTIEAGASIAVTGPSGSGKSTLLNIMGTLDVPDEGEVRIGGEPTAGLDDSAICSIRREKIGFVFQQHHLLPQCDVLENVLIPSAAEPGEETPDDYARELIERVGLGARMSHRPGELSGGECQRVALVRALINKPVLVLADEPTGSLDSAASGELAKLMIELNRERGTALVVVTHSDGLAEKMATQYELKDGLLVKQ